MPVTGAALGRSPFLRPRACAASTASHASVEIPLTDHMNRFRIVRPLLGTAVVLVLAACSSSRPVNRAPVEDRGAAAGRIEAPANVPPAVGMAAGATTAAPVVLPPGSENAGKPGYYTVKQGDTLIRIALEQGQSWRDLVRWNALDNPNRIEVGQVLRVVSPTVALAPAAPAATAPAGGVVAAAPASGVVVTPVPIPSLSRPGGAPAAGVVAPAPVATASAAAAATAPQPVPAAPAAATSPDDEIAWIWPTNGKLLAGFDETTNKGLDLGGKIGDPVLAVADGKVVYAGSGLRGYGNLIIVQHNKTYLSAYAHNQALLVRDDQSVRKGQKIAEMGSSDTDRVKLHFEIRKGGKPVDPAKYLPAR